MTDKPIRRVTSEWLASPDRWRSLTTADPVPQAILGSTPPPPEPKRLLPVQVHLLAVLADFGGTAHISELADALEVSEDFALDQARGLHRHVSVTRDLDTDGRPWMAVAIPQR